MQVEIPGYGELRIEHLLLDQNGTLSDRGMLIDGVAERLAKLRERLAVHVLSADTFGTLEQVTAALDVDGQRVQTGADKLTLLEQFGGSRCIAIGNGRNDVPMFEAAALAIAVLGPEGTSTAAAAAADVICRSVPVALDLLLDERLLIATLRA